jgi:mismatch-specific thymine-DNA glycosylase
MDHLQLFPLFYSNFFFFCFLSATMLPPQQTSDSHENQSNSVSTEHSTQPNSDSSLNNSFETLIASYAYTEGKTPTTDRILRKRKYTTESKNATGGTPSNISKTDTTPKRSPRKRSSIHRPVKGKPTGYTSPAMYAHLSTVSDHLAYGMRVLFVGINPGIASSANQHHYANPANAFWPCLSASSKIQLNDRYDLFC